MPAAVAVQRLRHLHRQLAGRREHEGQRPARHARGRGQALQQRQREGRRLAGAGGGLPEHVATGEQRRHGLGLDRRRLLVAEGRTAPRAAPRAGRGRRRCGARRVDGRARTGSRSRPPPPPAPARARSWPAADRAGRSGDAVPRRSPSRQSLHVGYSAGGAARRAPRPAQRPDRTVPVTGPARWRSRRRLLGPHALDRLVVPETSRRSARAGPGCAAAAVGRGSASVGLLDRGRQRGRSAPAAAGAGQRARRRPARPGWRRARAPPARTAASSARRVPAAGDDAAERPRGRAAGSTWKGCGS